MAFYHEKLKRRKAGKGPKPGTVTRTYIPAHTFTSERRALADRDRRGASRTPTAAEMGRTRDSYDGVKKEKKSSPVSSTSPHLPSVKTAARVETYMKENVPTLSGMTAGAIAGDTAGYPSSGGSERSWKDWPYAGTPIGDAYRRLGGFPQEGIAEENMTKLEGALPGGGIVKLGSSILSRLGLKGAGSNAMRLANQGGVPNAVTATSTSGLVPVNSKTLKTVDTILKEKFSKKALAWGGAWATAVFLGKWGQAESPEPISIQLSKHLIPDAQRTGDWSLVDEAISARDELLDLSWWEQAALWSPASPLVGITNKIKGAIEGANIDKKLTQRLKTQQETGATEADMWDLVNEEKALRDRELTDYYNEQRLITEREILRLREEAKSPVSNTSGYNVEDQIRLWEEYAARQRRLEEEARKSEAEFWLEYNKKLIKIRESQAPSSLNFGLL